jgi:hypothetical protein
VSGFSRFLPLSQREPADEAGVSSDRRRGLADVLERAADLIATAGPSSAALTRSFLDVAGLQGDAAPLTAADAGPAPITAGAPGLGVQHPGAATQDVALLRAIAARVRDGRRRSIRSLSAAVRALLILARELRRDPRLDPLIAGAAALYAAGSAPADRRAVIRGHTVRATDAEWAFGQGPVLEGTATAIAAFLLGVSDDPPRPPAIARG